MVYPYTGTNAWAQASYAINQCHNHTTHGPEPARPTTAGGTDPASWGTYCTAIAAYENRQLICSYPFYRPYLENAPPECAAWVTCTTNQITSHGANHPMNNCMDESRHSIAEIRSYLGESPPASCSLTEFCTVMAAGVINPFASPA